MEHISLKVTQPVMNAVAAGQGFQRQLAVDDASPNIRAQISAATAANIVVVHVGGCMPLAVGDTDAIWAVHQKALSQQQDFDDLYALLSRRPGAALTFSW